MLIPYRVKNPAKHFPFATLGLITANIIVYVLTTNSFLAIREDVLQRYAYTFGASPFINFVTAAFLHGDPFHLLGNMLFLWVFGPPVEDRLRIPRYLATYFAAGLVGDLLQAGLDSIFTGSPRPGIGASGCIMGVVGAYWYLYSWSTVCVFYWIWYLHGVWEVKAIWIVGLYLLMDLGEGILFGSAGVSGGVANFAHVGGGAAGALMCLAMRAKRDTEALSEAKAIRADAGDLSNMPLHALQTMVEEDPGNAELIRAMIKPALRLSQQSAIDEAMSQAGPGLIDKDPGLVAYYLADLRGNPKAYQPVYLLRLAGLMERSGEPERAIHLYRLISESQPTAPEAEAALYRMALCYWNAFKDAAGARSCLSEMQQRFPNGEMLPFGRDLLRRIC